MTNRFVSWVTAFSFFMLICAAAAYAQAVEPRTLVGQFAVLEQEAPQQKKWRIEGESRYIPSHLITRHFQEETPAAAPAADAVPRAAEGAASPLRPMIPALD